MKMNNCCVLILHAAFIACLLCTLPVAADEFAPEFFVFENGTRRIPSHQVRVNTLKELGFDGFGSANPRDLDVRLPLYDQAGLKIYSLYVGTNLANAQPKYDPIISKAIEQLKGRDTVIELFVQRGAGASDERAVALVRDIADQAQQSGLRVVLYPHSGFYIDTVGDAVRIAKLAERENVGVMFNVCHFLKVEPESDLRAALEAAKPFLWRVSICGADRRGQSWGQLIQPLDQGDFDQVELLKILRELGYDGAIGLQCFAIQVPPRENLERSITAWRAILKKVNSMKNNSESQRRQDAR